MAQPHTNVDYLYRDDEMDLWLDNDFDDLAAKLRDENEDVKRGALGHAASIGGLTEADYWADARVEAEEGRGPYQADELAADGRLLDPYPFVTLGTTVKNVVAMLRERGWTVEPPRD